MAFLTTITPNQQRGLTAVLSLAQTCQYEVAHTHWVTRLALRFFDELYPLHHYGEEERYFLLCASLLHDIGWIEGWKAHHKSALQIILSTPLLPFNTRERMVIGSIARYHRKALPDMTQDPYSALSPGDRQVVDKLAACLRVADGLDAGHKQRVKDITCRIYKHKISVKGIVEAPPDEEERGAMLKCDLLERVYQRKFDLTWKLI